jgi:transcriptional regulator with XRE-family HTH domain
MTQGKLAERANLSINVIRRIEKGDRAPSLESLERIAKALVLPPAELLNFEGKEFSSPQGAPEIIGLLNLLKVKKKKQIKKICDIAKIVIG